jgi:hypothetical protein
MPNPSRLDLESQLFGILKTLKTIHQDIQSKKISYPLYCSTIRQKIKDLMIVELTFQAKGLELEKILEKMMISEEFFDLIPQIHDYISLQEQSTSLDKTSPSDLSEYEKNLRDVTTARNKTAIIGNILINPLLLANLASEITANFITIFDFFKLEIDDSLLLQDNFQRLLDALEKFPGMDELFLDVKNTIRSIQSNGEISPKRKEIYRSFEQFYQRYLVFLKKSK